MMAERNKVGVPRNNPDYARLYNHKLHMEIHHLLGDKCISCGFSDWRALQIDHINGGGHRDRIRRCGKKGMGKVGGSQYYRYILRQIKLGSKDYQLLCANCNWIKRYEKNEGYGHISDLSMEKTTQGLNTTKE
jgi:hypothetical protein